MSNTQDVEIRIELSEPQTAVLEARQSLILEMAGQGGGKSQNIGYSSGTHVNAHPRARGFIGANTYLQLSQSTLERVFKTWFQAWGWEEYDPKASPWGAYVVDKKPPPHFVRFNRLRDYANTISFYNGALIFIGSLENYKAHEGKEFAWAHLDETKDTKEKALKEVIIGRLRQYGMWFNEAREVIFNEALTPQEAEAQGLKSWNPLYIHTSPAIDGAEWLVSMFKLDKFQKEIKAKVIQKEKAFFYTEFENKAVCIYSAYHNAPNLAPGFLKNQEDTLQEEGAILKLVHGYPFGQSGNAWFHAFRRDRHVQHVPYLPGVPILQTWDFNVVPYMTCLLAQIEYVTRYLDPVGNKHDAPAPGYTRLDVTRIRFFKEYCFESPRNSTEAICEQFAQDFTPEEATISYYGDASGLNRIPGLGSVTNFKIVEEYLQLYVHSDSKKVRTPNVAPLRRRDLINAMFKGEKYRDIEILIDEEMVKTIEDCENVKTGAAGKLKTKVADPNGKQYEKWGHTSDALEYLISEEFKYLMKQ